MNSTTNTISYLLQLCLALAIPLVNQYCAMMVKLLPKLWLVMGPFQIMLMSFSWTRSFDSRTHTHIYIYVYIYYIYLFIYLFICILFYRIYIYICVCVIFIYIYVYLNIYLSRTHIYIIFNVSESNFKVIGSSRPHVRISKYPHVLLKGVNSLSGLPPGWPLPRLEQPQMVQPPGAGGQGRDAGIPPIHHYITSIRDPRWNPLSLTLYTPLHLNLNHIHHLGPILEIMQCSGSTLHSMTFCRFQKITRVVVF